MVSNLHFSEYLFDALDDRIDPLSLIGLKAWTVKKESGGLDYTKQYINLHPERGYIPLR